MKTIFLNGAIIAENGTTQKCARAILASFDEGSELLKKWCAETENMFPNQPDLFAKLPQTSSLDVTRMLGGMISHDNCNPACDQGNGVEQIIFEMAAGMGLPEGERVLFQGSCHNHLCNTWMDHIETYMAGKLEEHLKNDHKLIPPNLRVAC